MKYSPRAARRLNVRRIAMEFVAIAATVSLALMAISDLAGRAEAALQILGLSVGVALCQAGIHALLGGSSYSWRFFSYQDGWALLGSAIAALAVTSAILGEYLPATGWIIVWIAALAGASGPRLLARIAHRQYNFRFIGRRERDGSYLDRKQSLLMVGYGDHVADFIRSHNRKEGDFRIVGVVHIDQGADTSTLRGVPVLGSIDKLRAIVRRLTSADKRPDYLVLTRDEMSKRSIGEILSITDKIGIPVAWLPRSDNFNSGLGQQLRPIKLDDLLPRSTSNFDAQACAEVLGGSTVLVTGAGGSIGSELVRQIGSLEPSLLILTDASEHALYMVDQEIGRLFPTLPIISKLLDVRDRKAVFRTLATHRPDYVFHAAALKHVPIVEAQACEGVVTNVIGSRNVADAAAEYRVGAMVMVSTDKAVNPANVMGATKRLAEAYCQAMDAASAEVKGRTRYVTVRFGNVLGSNGSVVPLFQKQLLQGGPLTVTHPDVERFFMTIPEASRLILEALLLGVDDHGGDRGIFVLDMGKPVKIADLARQVIRLSGLVPERDVRIVYTGLRPGEKLYEELMHETENLVPTEHPSLMVARPRFVQIQTVRSQIDVLRSSAEAGDSDEVLRLLKVYIPEFATTAREAQTAIEQQPFSGSGRPEAI